MTTTETHVEKNLDKLEAQLKLWRAKFEDLVAKASTAGHQAKIDSRKQLDELKGHLALAQTKLDEAKAAGSAKWEILKDGVELVWKDVEVTFKKLVH